MSNNEKYEFLTQKWIEGNTSPVDDEGRLYVWKRDLQNLIVPKQEITEDQAWETLSDIYDIPNKSYIREVMKVVAEHVRNDTTIGELKERLTNPTVPQFVADWINYNQEDDLSDTIHFTIYGLYADWPYTNSSVELRKPVLDWLEEDRNNYFKLVDATRYDYEIEEEPKYYVIDKEDNILLIRGYGGIEKADNLKITNSGGGALKLTEQEIKDYDPRYWAFAKQVEELEE